MPRTDTDVRVYGSVRGRARGGHAYVYTERQAAPGCATPARRDRVYPARE